MEILLWLVPAVLVTVGAMGWVGWAGREPREVDRGVMVRRLAKGMAREFSKARLVGDGEKGEADALDVGGLGMGFGGGHVGAPVGREDGRGNSMKRRGGQGGRALQGDWPHAFYPGGYRTADAGRPGLMPKALKIRGNSMSALPDISYLPFASLLGIELAEATPDRVTHSQTVLEA